MIKKLIEYACLNFEIYVKEKIILKKHKTDFYKTFGGHIFFQVLYAAIKFDLFTLLDNRNSLTLHQIATELKVEHQPCRIMVFVLTSLGILKKNGDLYSNTWIAKELYSNNSKENVIAYMHLQNEVYYKAMPYFYESVKTNSNKGVCVFKGDEQTLYERLEHDPELQKIFQKAMEELSRRSNKFLTKFLDMKNIKHLVDIGGGNGTNIIAIANSNPKLKASVFDLPGVTKLALENIEKHGMSNRLGAIAGNCFKDDFPTDADCFIFCHFFTMWSKEEDLMLLKKAYKALPPGGKTVIFNMMQNDNDIGPLSACVGSPYFLAIASGRGMLYSWSEYKELFREAGFVDIGWKKLPLDHGFIWGYK